MAQTTIFDAIAEGDRAAVERVLDADPGALHARDADGLTPLMRALYDGKRAIVDVLLARSPLLDVHEASALGRVEEVSRLVRESSARVNEYSADGFTPLHLAAFFGHAAVAELLIDHGADLEARSRNPLLHQVTPLHSAAAGRQNEVAELLLARGADPNAAQPGGWTPLHQAAASGNLELCRALLGAGANRVASADDRTRPIDFAIEAGHRDVVELLRSGA